MKDQFQNPAAWQKAEELIEQAYSTGATELSLSGLRLRSLPESITKLTQLESLDLSGCNTLKSIARLTALKQLRTLSLIGCHNLTSISVLSEFKNLKQLNLSISRRSIKLSELSGLTQLTSLSLRGWHTLDSVDAISSLINLKRLDLSLCINLNNIDALSSLDKLEYLDLAFCNKVNSLKKLDRLKNLKSLNLTGLRDLTSINVSQLKKLTTLDLKHCESLRKINSLSNLTNLQNLNLGYCIELTEFGEVSKLTDLKVLNLSSSNNLKDIGFLSSLDKLQKLTLSDCINLVDLSPIFQLESLNNLDISWCTQIEKIESIHLLKGLQALNLSYCKGLKRIGDLTKLTSLQSLNLSACNSSIINDTVFQLNQLESLELSYSENKNIIKNLYSCKNLVSLSLTDCLSLTEFKLPSTLTKLERLDLSGCRNLEVINNLCNLRSLKHLDLRDCAELKQLNEISYLTNLESLNLANCISLRKLEGLVELNKLKKLDIDRCKFISSTKNLRLPENTSDLNITGVFSFQFIEQLMNRAPYLTYCYGSDIRIEATPTELTKNFYLPTIEDWYHEIQKGYIQQNKIKLHFLGNGRIGKSQLSRSLLGKDYDESLPSTHAIKVDSWDAKVSDEQSIEVTNWDFGGQDVYLSTHSLFLDEQAVYCLVWHPDYENNEQTEENGVVMQNHHLSYWLSYIHSLSGSTPPIIVTQSRCDKASDSQFPQIPNPQPFDYLKVAETSAKTQNGLIGFKEQLHQAIKIQLELNGEVKLPKSWEYVSEKLKQLKDLGNKTVEFDHYLRLCEEDDEQKVSSPKALLVYLHNSGQVFYKEYLFNNALILDQSWALQGVYSLLEREKTLPIIRQQNGRFSRELISQLLWSDEGYSEDEQTLFLGMMAQCGVCFSIGESQYITPDSLPELKNVSSQIEAVWRNNDPDVHVKLNYEFLHLAVARNLLCKIGERAGEYAIYWKYGCCYYDQKSGSCVLISMNFHQGEQLENFKQPGSISIELSGANSTELAKHLVDSILACKTFSKDPEVKWLKKDERATDKPDQLEESNKSEPDFSQVPKANKQPKVYMSYAWGKQDEHHEEVSSNIYNSLKQEIGFRVIRDKEELSAGDSVQTFEELIGWSNHIIVIISKKYLQSEDCMKELAYIYQTSKDEKHFKTKVIPIVLDDVDITSSPKRIKYVQHWQELHKELESYNQGVSDATLTASINLYADIRDSLFSSLSWCNDIVLKRDQRELDAEGYKTIISLLKLRIKETEALADN